MRQISPASAGLLGILLVGSAIFSATMFAAAALAAPKTTTLRLVGAPKGIFDNSLGVVKLRSVTQEVRNVGDETATNVVVTVVAPNGEQIPLEGPEELKANRSAVYSADSLYEFISNEKKLKTQVHCSNCN